MASREAAVAVDCMQHQARGQRPVWVSVVVCMSQTRVLDEGRRRYQAVEGCGAERAPGVLLLVFGGGSWGSEPGSELDVVGSSGSSRRGRRRRQDKKSTRTTRERKTRAQPVWMGQAAKYGLCRTIPEALLGKPPVRGQVNAHLAALQASAVRPMERQDGYYTGVD